MPLTQTGRLVTVSTPLGADVFAATAFAGREEFSRPFSFALDLVSENVAVKAADLVGKPVGWAVNDPDDAPRPFHGVVRRLAAGPTVARGLRGYRAEVVPWLWFLTRTADCKIFQNKTAPDIVKAVFDGFGFSDYKFSLSGSYPTREYCVQYRETAFDFVSRLLEEEGIFYFFTYAADKHTLVLADAASAYADCSPHNAPEYLPDRPAAAAISAWERRFEYRSGKYAHTDYNFTTPTTSLLASTDTLVSLPNIGKFELFDYPGNHGVTADGTSRAKVRMEADEAVFDTAAGASRCSSFAPGCTFALKGHPSDAGSFVLTAVEHSASEPWAAGSGGGGAGSYANTFTAAPAAVVCRPARVTPRGEVRGPQTAVVVGPSGEEIYTDKYGRVKVQFYWDRLGKADETSSCWVRVSEAWAGKNWGSVFLPRIGQEVIVSFLEGDPDRPLVTGRVYNAALMPPYALPDNQTQSGVKSRSSKGGGTDDFNELRFEDKKGSEDVYFHAQKDAHRVVENDDDLKVGHDQTIEVKNARTLTVKEADETITIEKGNRTRTVKQGDDLLTVETGKRTVVVKTGDEALEVDTGNRSVLVKTGNDTHTVKTGNREVTVELGNDTLTVKTGNQTTKISVGSSTTEATQGITLKVGQNSIKIEPAGITIAGLTVKIEGQVQTSIKGVMTEVNGDAMLKLKGGVAMLN